MHPKTDAAPTSCKRSLWQTSLIQGVVCLACLVAGAALVAMAAPHTWLSAGATQAAASDTVLLDFTAKWCRPCQEMSPIIDRLAQQGYPVRKVDVDQRRDLAERFRVTSMPTFVLLVNGREVQRLQGSQSEEQLRRVLLQIPMWQQEFARQAAPQRRTNEVREAAVADESTPAPFTIDLGPSRPAERPAPAAAPKRGLSLPFFGESQPAATVAAVPRAEPSVARGSDPDEVPKLSPATNGDPMLASTRLRVKDASGMNFGTGTILESRAGRTLILTCGHIFRNLSDDGLVEVDVFPRGQKPMTFVGTIVKYDLEADVGLVAIPTLERLASIPLANADQPLQVGDSLLSIGCGGGENPTRETIEVTAINRYTGSDNIECTGLPVPGRSGGGLFRGKQLVGVCIAADPRDERGVYTALPPIYDLLESSGFGHLLPVGKPAKAPEIAQQEPEVSPFATIPEVKSEAPAGMLPGKVDFGSAMADAMTADVLNNVGSNTQSASPAELQNILQQSPDSEIICIVRPKNPQVPSRVVIIHEASPKLVSYLLDSVGPLPAAALSMNAPLSRDSGLIPTSGQGAEPFPSFAEAVEMEPVSRRLTKPTRPASPR